eukprot:7019353-Alexandrium_andersonii.AAC.1
MNGAAASGRHPRAVAAALRTCGRGPASGRRPCVVAAATVWAYWPRVLVALGAPEPPQCAAPPGAVP